MAKQEIDSLKRRSQILHDFHRNHPNESLDQIEMIQQEIEHREMIHEKYTKELREAYSFSEPVDDLALAEFHEESLKMFLEQDEEFKALYRKRHQDNKIGCVSSGNHVSFLGSNDDSLDDFCDHMSVASISLSGSSRNSRYSVPRGPPREA